MGRTTEPTILQRPQSRLFEISREVTLPFGDVAAAAIPALFSALDRSGVPADGPLLFRYPRIAMPHLTVGFAVPVGAGAVLPDDLVESSLPAGHYAHLCHWGPYERLIAATARLLDFISAVGECPDVVRGPDGDYFAGRFEVYPNGPDDEPNPDRWETQLYIKLA